MITGPDPTSLDQIREEAERALDVFSTSGDHARAAQACYVLGIVHEREGATRKLEEVTRLGLAHADRSGRLREEVGPRWNLAWAVRAGETPVREAVRTCEEILDRRGLFHPGVLCELATLHAMEGEVEQARDMLARARRNMVERWRFRRPLMWAARSSAAVERLAGDVEGSERELRAALEMGARLSGTGPGFEDRRGPVAGPVRARPIEGGGWVRDDGQGVRACAGSRGPSPVACGEGPDPGEPR